METKKPVYIICELSALALSLKKQLDSLGYLGVPIQDPMEGIRQSILNRPYAVIADFQFQSIMGLEVLQQIKIKYPDILSILLVNTESHPDAKRAIGLGSRIVPKPVELRRLEEALKEPPTAEPPGERKRLDALIMARNPNIRFQIRKILGDDVDVVEVASPAEFLEKYFLRRWAVVVFDVDNDQLPPDEFLKVAAERRMRPDRFVLLARQWDHLKMDRFLSRGFPHFARIPLDESELRPILHALITHA